MNRVPLEQKVLSENDRIAASLRERFRAARRSVREPDQFAGVRQDHAAGAHAGSAAAATRAWPC